MKTDVLIVGSGPSAAAAAITASRMGAKTTLMMRSESMDMGGGCAGGAREVRAGRYKGWRNQKRTDEMRRRKGITDEHD